ncbi:MAG: hypothetical protein AAFR38_00925 [Planctomycetota bacterium]
MSIAPESLHIHGFARFETGDTFIDAWRQAHYASQVAAELGKAWGEYRPDDSHSSFRWFEDAGGRGVEGVPSVHPKGLRARLKIEGLQLAIAQPDGRTLSDLSLRGRTLGGAMEWLRGQCEEELGPPKQDAKPAPDLPKHLIAGGAEFGADRTGLNDVADLYHATNAVLEKLREAMGGDRPLGPTQVWPHHFDMAGLCVLKSDGGSMSATVGVGLAVPDDIHETGYWYVTGWTRDGLDASGAMPDMGVGHWHGGGGGIPMGVLPVGDVAAAPGEKDRIDMLARFVGLATNAVVEVIGRG